MAVNTLMATDFHFPGQLKSYKGKVREVYYLENELVILIATDRLSAFDVVMPKGIPYKGQILNQIATKMLTQTAELVPNWMLHSPDPNVTIGIACEPIKIEMVIRGYLAGHAAREYHAGKRSVCGVSIPEGMRENDAFPSPIITPATKAEDGAHDEDISRVDILERGIVSVEEYDLLEKYTRALFSYGTQYASDRGLILVDTKYEFGKTSDGTILLIDEVHTPDSSRYFYKEGYEQRQARGEPQKQLSKEFVRQWLIEHGFQGKPGQKIPEMNETYLTTVSDRYIELYENITGEQFIKADTADIHRRIDTNVTQYLAVSSEKS